MPEQYIACLDWDFAWSMKYRQRAIDLYNQGLPLYDMARQLHRPAKEVFVLLVDLIEQDTLKPRPGGIYGGQRLNPEEHNYCPDCGANAE